ncbi:hypothetical protein S40288_00475 [Stachybotrys chartarum IBT 40288]|nr:hypothetical protein S40288_00475 [Stachybotrys chartarum IBT 40288]
MARTSVLKVNPPPTPNCIFSISEPGLTIPQTLIVPAVISLLIFLLLTFVLVPVWRHYRARYGQYLPLDAITSQTMSLRHRILNRITQWILATPWRRSRDTASAVGNGTSDNDLEDGEELSVVDDDAWSAVEGQSQLGRHDSTSRLSRDLEAVFRDDSDDEPSRLRAN